MADQIRVLIVDDIPETRDHLTKLLGFESDIEVVGAAASGAQALELAGRAHAGRRPDGHQHAGHGRHRRDGAARRRGPRRRRRHDVGPGRGGLPPPLDARRRARVPRQAVQQRRAHRLDPPGLRPRAGEAEPARGHAGHGDRRRRRRAATATRATTTARSSRSSARRAASAGRRSRSTWPSPPRPSSASRSSSWTARSSSATSASCSTSTRRTSRSPTSSRSSRPGEPESLDTFVINHSAGVRVLLAPPSPEMAELITPTARQAGPRGAPPPARPRHRRLHLVVQRHDAGDPRRGRRRS